jgi:hypothetical protein
MGLGFGIALNEESTMNPKEFPITSGSTGAKASLLTLTRKVTEIIELEAEVREISTRKVPYKK